MATSGERLEQLEQALQQAATALAVSELQDCDSGDSGWCAGPSCDNNFICLDGRHSCARETL